MIRNISAADARRKVEAGATMVDIRAADEHRRERIDGAINVPLDRIGSEALPGEVLVFHCRSGVRTGQASQQLAAAAEGRECFIVEGGLNGWHAAGLPVTRTANAPLEMQRQVMIAAGLLVLSSALLALWVSPLWIWLALLVGSGLTFAGVTGICGMAHLLARMPWNRASANG